MSWEFRFGTNGWRGILGEDFTFPRLRAVLRGVANWIADSPGGREVIVAHDTRFMGDRMAQTASALLRERGLLPLIADRPTATPVVGRGVLRHGAAAAVVFTASHNASDYHGLKIFGADGSCIAVEAAREIEALVSCASDAAVVLDPAEVDAVDFVTPYVGEVLSRIDGDAIRSARISVVYDAMYGAGSGVLDCVLERAGARVRVRRGDGDPRFGGIAPDPVRSNLGELCDDVAAMRGLRLGIATDGDADRFAVVDADGQMLSETESVALLIDHLARTGRLASGVAISIATGSLVEKVAADHGLSVVRHSIGFSHLSKSLNTGDCDVAGEESGGFAFGGFSRDKDGLMASALMVELLSSLRAPLRTRLDELTARHGTSACGRVAVRLRPEARDALEKLFDSPPGKVDGQPVRRVSTSDGLHLGLDDGFLMFRMSGTEPVLRVYAEAPAAASLRTRLSFGVELLGASSV